MLGMASHRQLFAVVFVNSLMLPTPLLESNKFAGHQEARLYVPILHRDSSVSVSLSQDPSHLSIASANPDVLAAVFFAAADASLQPSFFINVIISSGFSLFNSRIWYELFGLVVFDMDSLG